MTESSEKAKKNETDTESATYKGMLIEVENLVKDVGQPDLDLDDIVTKIERGYNLIKAMRTRLETTKQKVEQLRLDFE